MRTLPLALLAGLLAISSPAFAAPVPGETEARPMVKVDPAGRYRVVYDIRSDKLDAGIAKGLYYARGLYEAYRKQGVTPAQVDARLVLHGDAAAMLLKDETYQRAIGDPFAVNTNAKVVQDLIDLGVGVEICHSVMKSKGWKPTDVLPGVTIVHDGYSRLIKLQNDGYAYIGGF
jgi:intracellular sulfur oxidation DsrE/DsrF family protein